jgi:hypothetical protein
VLSRIRQETEAQWDNRDGVFRGLVLTERGGVACGGIRYNFGTTKGEISGERPCKRRSAKHLEFLPSLLEGSFSIRLSYGRTAESLHSKAFLDRTESIRVLIEFLCGVRSSRFSLRKLSGQMSGLAIRPREVFNSEPKDGWFKSSLRN